MVERLHRRLKDALRARAATAVNWANHIPWVLLSLRTAPQEDDGISPAERTYGSPLAVPGQFLTQNEIDFEKVQTNVNNILSKTPSLPRHNVPAGRQQPPLPPPELERAPSVLVRADGARPPLAARYDGPFAVVARSPHFFTVQVGEQLDTISTSRLKPAHTPDGLATPPRRGRPP